MSLSERKTKTKRIDRTRRTSRTKRSMPTKRITPTQRTLTKNLEILDYGEGVIETEEFEQVGLSKKGRLVNKAPVEAVSGVDAKKGKSLRRKGLKRVSDLRKKDIPVSREISSLPSSREEYDAIIAEKEYKMLKSIQKSNEEPTFEGSTLKDITEEVQRKEDQKLLAKMQKPVVSSTLPPSSKGRLVQATQLPKEEIGSDYSGISRYYVFQDHHYEAMKFDDLQEAHKYKDTLKGTTAVVLEEKFTKAAPKAKQRLKVNKRIDDEIKEQRAIRAKVNVKEKEARRKEREQRQVEVGKRNFHSTHAKDFELGEIYYYRWTNNFNQYDGKVKIVKINPKSVRIQLMEAPRGYKKGQTWNVRLVEQTKNNGLFQLSVEEKSQVLDVEKSQVNIRVTDTNYKDRREFRRLGLVPERDSDGKFVGWRGNIDPADLPEIEKLGTVEKTKEIYTQEEVHTDELNRIDRKLSVLRTREQKKEKEIEDTGKRIKDMQDVIPLGQPILVGHHSEKRHRKHLATIQNLSDKQVEKFNELEAIKSQINTLENQKEAMSGRKTKSDVIREEALSQDALFYKDQILKIEELIIANSYEDNKQFVNTKQELDSVRPSILRDLEGKKVELASINRQMESLRDTPKNRELRTRLDQLRERNTNEIQAWENAKFAQDEKDITPGNVKVHPEIKNYFRQGMADSKTGLKSKQEELTSWQNILIKIQQLEQHKNEKENLEKIFRDEGQTPPHMTKSMSKKKRYGLVFDEAKENHDRLQGDIDKLEDYTSKSDAQQRKVMAQAQYHYNSILSDRGLLRDVKKQRLKNWADYHAKLDKVESVYEFDRASDEFTAKNDELVKVEKQAEKDLKADAQRAKEWTKEYLPMDIGQILRFNVYNSRSTFDAFKTDSDRELDDLDTQLETIPSNWRETTSRYPSTEVTTKPSELDQYIAKQRIVAGKQIYYEKNLEPSKNAEVVGFETEDRQYFNFNGRYIKSKSFIGVEGKSKKKWKEELEDSKIKYKYGKFDYDTDNYLYAFMINGGTLEMSHPNKAFTTASFPDFVSYKKFMAETHVEDQDWFLYDQARHYGITNQAGLDKRLGDISDFHSYPDLTFFKPSKHDDDDKKPAYEAGGTMIANSSYKEFRTLIESGRDSQKRNRIHYEVLIKPNKPVIIKFLDVDVFYIIAPVIPEKKE